jgi:ribosome-binding protein aMBF1 (putative translation factor)
VPRRGDKPEPLAKAFGEAVRTARGDRTLVDVAHRIPNMDPKYLGEIELGWHSPTIVTAKRIANALEVPLAELARAIDADSSG